MSDDLRTRIFIAISSTRPSQQADAVLAEIAKESVIVHKTIWDRVQTVACLAHEWVNAPMDSSIARTAEDALTHAIDALQPNDLDEATT